MLGKHGGVFYFIEILNQVAREVAEKPFLRRWQSRQLSTQFKPDIMDTPPSARSNGRAVWRATTEKL